jgi:hypothetical protein
MVKKAVVLCALALAATMMFSGAALADKADDMKWIAQCLKDNKDEGVKEEVVFKYCKCMNDKMDENETRSITQWEKANPKAANECSKKAGWK